MNLPAILFIHNTYFEKGGEDSVVNQEIDVLRRQGYAVHILFFNNDAYRGFNLKILQAPARLFFSWSAYIKVYRLVRKHRIRYVHVHNFSYSASASVFWAAKAAGANTLFTVHNYRLFCLNGIFFRQQQTCMLCEEKKSFGPGIAYRCFKSSTLFSSLLAASIRFHRKINTWHRKVDTFVVINPLIHQLLLNHGVSAEKLFDKSNFLEARLTPDPSENKPREDFYLFTGRMSEEKGVRHIVEAFQANGKKLVIVGNGPLENWIRQRSNHAIQYHNAVPREALFSMYRSCKALLFGSLWPEGQPMTLIEAQSFGTPVIAASSAVTTQIIGSQRGLLYKPGDIGSLNHAIGTFEALSTEERKVMSEFTRSYFREHYTEERHLVALNTLYAS